MAFQRTLTALVTGGSYRAHSIQTLIINVLLSAIGVTTGMLAARLLGPHGRGELAAIQSWSYLLAALSMVGLQDAIIYYGGKKRALLGTLTVSATALVLLVGSAVGLTGYLLMPWLLSAQVPGVVSCARLYLLSIVTFALGGIPIFALRAQMRLASWNVLRAVTPLVWLATLTGFWIRGTATAIQVSTLYLWVSLGLAVAFGVYGVFILSPPLRIQPRLWPMLLRFGLPAWLGTLPQYLNVRLDQLLMASLLPASTLGQYVAAVSWAGAVGPLNSAFSSVLFPRVASTSDPEQQRGVIRKAFRVSMLSIVPASVILGVLARPVIPWAFGPTFTGAVTPAYVLLCAAVFSGLSAVLEEGLKGMGHPRAVVTAEMAGLVITVGALAVLLVRYGALGAAVASLMAYAATFFILLLKFRSLSKCERRTA